jgi:hypothetical protein
MLNVEKNITDRSQFSEYFQKYFFQGNVFFKSQEMNINVQFLRYQSGVIILKSDQELSQDGNFLCYVRSNASIISAVLKYHSSQQGNLYAFEPLKIQVLRMARSEERQSLEKKGTSAMAGDSNDHDISDIIISDLMSDFMIIDFIREEFTKVENIKDIINAKLINHFDFVRIYFPTMTLADHRMKYFYQERKPFFIPNLNESASQTEQNQFQEYYKSDIWANDEKVKEKKLVSEVTVPLLYKSMIPFGYIQVNNAIPMSDKEFSLMRKIGLSASELFAKNNIFITNDISIPVTDISKKGLGIKFKDRRWVRFFRENRYSHFNLNLPENKKTSILAIIRNINILSDGFIKVGCEITNIESLGEVYFDDFLNN